MQGFGCKFILYKDVDFSYKQIDFPILKLFTNTVGVFLIDKIHMLSN